MVVVGHGSRASVMHLSNFIVWNAKYVPLFSFFPLFGCWHSLIQNVHGCSVPMKWFRLKKCCFPKTKRGFPQVERMSVTRDAQRERRWEVG